MINQHRTLELSLAERAGWLNDGVSGYCMEESLNLLADFGWLAYGVPEKLGGDGGKLINVIEACA